jgi:hypothetical protein
MCQEVGPRHLICLSRFLVTLKRRYYGLQVGNLVECLTVRECEILREVHAAALPKAAQDEWASLGPTAKTIELAFSDGKIVWREHMYSLGAAEPTDSLEVDLEAGDHLTYQGRQLCASS